MRLATAIVCAVLSNCALGDDDPLSCSEVAELFCQRACECRTGASEWCAYNGRGIEDGGILMFHDTDAARSDCASFVATQYGCSDAQPVLPAGCDTTVEASECVYDQSFGGSYLNVTSDACHPYCVRGGC